MVVDPIALMIESEIIVEFQTKVLHRTTFWVPLVGCVSVIDTNVVGIDKTYTGVKT